MAPPYRGNPLQRRGVQFRIRPSSALAAASAAARRAVNPAQHNPFASTAGPPPQMGDPRDFYQRQFAPEFTPAPPWDRGQADWQAFQPGAGTDDRAASLADQRASTADAFSREMMRSWMESQQPDPEQAARMQAEYDLRMKELDLNRALLAGDMAEANRIKAAIDAGRAAMQRAFGDYRGTVDPIIEKGLAVAGQIEEKYLPEFQRIAGAETAGIGAAFGEGEETVSDLAQLLGAGTASERASLGEAGLTGDILGQQATNVNDSAQRVLDWVEQVGVTGLQATAADDRSRIEAMKKQDALEWDARERDVERQIRDLAIRDQMLDVDYERAKLQWDDAMRSLGGDPSKMDAVSFGRTAATQWIASNAGALPMDQVSYLQGIVGDFLEQPLPAEAYTREGLQGWLDALVDPDDPTSATQAEAKGLTSQDVQLLLSSIDAYKHARDNWTSPPEPSPASSGGAPRGGYAQRGHQAPNNYANRNHPDYRRRAQWIRDVGQNLITAAFPHAKVGGVNYYRPPSQVGNGRARNSDHQSAGAVDVYGRNLQELKAIEAWARRQPWASVVIHSGDRHHEGHHVHISVDVGWVKNNWG